MEIRVHDDRIFDLVDKNEEFEKLVGNMQLTEGPIWDYRENRLIFNNIPPSETMSWSERDGARVLFNNGGKWNGMAFDAQGRMIVCAHATSQLLRCDTDGGNVEVLAGRYEGFELNSPNDVVVKADGSIYFTDPTFGRQANDPAAVHRPLPSQHRPVYRLQPATGELAMVADDFGNPNGLCFSPDETLLYVNDSPNYCIRVYDVQADGTLANSRLFAQTKGLNGVMPDGMKVDELGNLLCTAQDGLHWFSPDGTCLGVVLTPDKALNMVWGGPDGRQLYITCIHSVLRLKTRVRGLAHIQHLQGQ